MRTSPKIALIVLFGSFSLSFASLPSQAGWKIKLGDKVIAGKPDGKKADDKKPDDKKPEQAATQPAPSIVCDSAASIHVCYAFSGSGNTDSKISKGNEMACKFMK